MKVRVYLVSALLGMGLSSFASAQDQVVGQDTKRVEQDKSNLQTDKDELAKIDEAIKQDRATGNKVQLKKDRETRRQMVRNRKQDKNRLHKDVHETKVDSK